MAPADLLDARSWAKSPVPVLTGDPLHDPNRHTRAQKLGWKPDGTPDFGVPVADTVREGA